MKRIMFVAVGVLMAVLWLYSLPAFAAGTVTQSMANVYPNAIVVTFTCVGDGTDGSIPPTALKTNILSAVKGYYLYTVTVNPGSTAPEAADVFLLDAAGEDLLGSTDGGTTASKGLNLIHATLTKTTIPYSHYTTTHYTPAITGALTLKVLNQATVSATYTVELVFVRALPKMF